MADFIKLNDLLSTVDWNTVTEKDSFEELPEGYYCCLIEKAELKPNKANTNMQVSFTYKVIENGLAEVTDNRGNSVWQEIPHTQNRKIFRYYPLKTTGNFKRFIEAMMKFEGEERGKPKFSINDFKTEDEIEKSLDKLVGSGIYVQVYYKEAQGQKNCWNDIISWDKAEKLGLPC